MKSLVSVIVLMLIVSGCSITPMGKSNEAFNKGNYQESMQILLDAANHTNDIRYMKEIGYFHLNPDTPFFDVNKGYQWLEIVARRDDLRTINFLFKNHPDIEEREYWANYGDRWNDVEAVAYLIDLNKSVPEPDLFNTRELIRAYSRSNAAAVLSDQADRNINVFKDLMKK